MGLHFESYRPTGSIPQTPTLALACAFSGGRAINNSQFAALWTPGRGAIHPAAQVATSCCWILGAEKGRDSESGLSFQPTAAWSLPPVALGTSSPSSRGCPEAARVPPALIGAGQPPGGEGKQPREQGAQGPRGTGKPRAGGFPKLLGDPQIYPASSSSPTSMRRGDPQAPGLHQTHLPSRKGWGSLGGAPSPFQRATPSASRRLQPVN